MMLNNTKLSRNRLFAARISFKRPSKNRKKLNSLAKKTIYFQQLSTKKINFAHTGTAVASLTIIITALEASTTTTQRQERAWMPYRSDQW
jgi:hypothetical protein